MVDGWQRDLKGGTLKTIQIHSSIPYFILVALFGLMPVLNNKYPTQFFYSVSPWWVEVVSTFAGIAAATLGFLRLWARLEKRERAKSLVLEAIGFRHRPVHPLENNAASAGRLISRLVRNVEEDLREIEPDFSQDSLRRLERFFPKLLEEIGCEEDALIRVGVAGVYLGETVCRNFQWQWRFNADPALRQFGYLASDIQRQERNQDPFAWAADLMTGKRKMLEFIEEMK